MQFCSTKNIRQRFSELNPTYKLGTMSDLDYYDFVVMKHHIEQQYVSFLCPVTQIRTENLRKLTLKRTLPISYKHGSFQR